MNGSTIDEAGSIVPGTSRLLTRPSRRTCAVVEQILATMGVHTEAGQGEIGKAGIGGEFGAADPSLICPLVAAFIAAGTARVNQILSPRPWLQVNIGFNSPALQWPNLVLGEFPEVLDKWLATQSCDQFHFVHKPPGIRARFFGHGNSLADELAELLNRLVKRGVIGCWSSAPFDAEVHQFGGEVGLDLAHDYFTAESVAVLAYHRLRLSGASVLSPHEFSLALMDAFFREVTGDQWELWDLWCNMGLTGRLPPELLLDNQMRERARLTGLSFLPLLRDRDAMLARVSPREREIFTVYALRLPPIVHRVQAAVREGLLLWGLREILPFWIIFHWNRMAFDFRTQQRLALLMAHMLNPKC